MFGVDRCAIRVELDAEIDLVTLGIQKKFPTLTPSLGHETQSFNFKSHRFLNQIKVKRKFDRSSIKIDFNYPRYFRENNIIPSDSIEKEIVDREIIRLIEEISLEKIKINQVYYEYIEVTIQEKVNSFYYYHNLVSLIYKALCKKYKTKEKSQYANYSEKLDRFYSTGFQFMLQPGMKMRLYSKLHEHNPKTPMKERGAILRTEYRITRGVLKKLFETDKIIELEIEYMKPKLGSYLERGILQPIQDELELNHKKLVKTLRGFNSRHLKAQIKDLQEWIFDYSCAAAAVTEVSDKSIRQTKRYLESTKIALEESQNVSSPKRENFGNLKRLDEFIKIYLCSDKAFTHTQKDGFMWY